MAELDANLKVLIEANSAALGVLLTKIASGEADLAEAISHVSATDSDLRSAIAGTSDAPAPATEAPSASD